MDLGHIVDIYQHTKSTVDDGANYIKLYDIIGPISSFTILAITGTNTTYTNGIDFSLKKDIVLFDAGAYNEDNLIGVDLKEYDWRFHYSNTRIAGRNVKLFIGYTVDDEGNRKYGIYSTNYSGHELHLQFKPYGRSYYNINFNPEEIEKEKIIKVNSQTYQDVYFGGKPSMVLLKNDPLVLNYGKSLYASYKIEISNLNYIHQIGVPDGYTVSLKDSTGTDYLYKNLKNAISPLTLQIAYNKDGQVVTKNGNYNISLYESYDEGVKKKRGDILLTIPVNIGTVIVSSMDEIKNFGKNGIIYIYKEGTFTYVNNKIIQTSPIVCNSTDRPTIGLFEGFEMYDTTLNKKIIWDGSTWVNIDGTSLSSIPTVGTTSSRPVDVSVGFQYFDTDLNKPIWSKGDNTWVDSTGATV